MYQELSSSSSFALASSHVCPMVQRRSLLPCIYEERYLASHVPDTHINLECDEIIDWDNLDSCDMYTPVSSDKHSMEKSASQCDITSHQNLDNDDRVNMCDQEDFPPPNSPINGISMEEKPVLYLQNRYVTSLLQLWRDSAVENGTAGNDLYDGSGVNESVDVTDAGTCAIGESSSNSQSQETASPSSSQGNEMLSESSECSEMSSDSENCSLKLPDTDAALQSDNEHDPTPISSYQMAESLSSCPSTAGNIDGETIQLYQVSNSNSFHTINTISNSNSHQTGRSSPELFHQEFFPFGRSSSRSQSPSTVELMSHLGSRYEQFRSLSPTIVRSPSPLSSRSSSPRFFRTPSPLDEIRHGLSGLPLNDYGVDDLVFYEDRYVTRSFSPFHSSDRDNRYITRSFSPLHGSDREVPDVDMEFHQTVEDSDVFPSLNTYYRERTLNSCQDQVVPGSIEE